VIDTLKGAALIATFIGVLVVFAMWVPLWENVWRVSVEPVRGAIYDTRLNIRHSSQSPWPFALPSLILDVVAVGGVSAELDRAVGVVV
jgi:hypothetical protein